MFGLFIHLFLTIPDRPILKIYQTDLRQIFMVGSTMTKISFSIPKHRCHGNQILLILVHVCRWTQAASGAAGQANSRHPLILPLEYCIIMFINFYIGRPKYCFILCTPAV